VSAIACASSSSGQSLDKTWLFQLGAYVPRVDPMLQVNGSGGIIGTEIDFETALGLERSRYLTDLMVEWRPGDDWVLNCE
jgi:hypothetical protein